jgi:hypothetical protein
VRIFAIFSRGTRSITNLSPHTRTATMSPARHGTNCLIALTKRMQSDPPYLCTVVGMGRELITLVPLGGVCLLLGILPVAQVRWLNSCTLSS